MKKGFIFYRDRCVGCAACEVACLLENGIPPKEGWRNVFLLNEQHFPGIPVFSWSLACNHCEEPACAEACPADAFTLDAETGALILDDHSCIGCGYCFWACPYDAPVYREEAGVMSKCTLCVHRLQQEDDPACVSGCPVDALQFGDPAVVSEESEPPDEWIRTPLHPAIRIVTSAHVPATETSYKTDPGLVPAELPEMPEKKLSFRKEWPLYIFTLILPLMSGLIARYMFRPQPWIVIVYPLLGILAGVVSLGHLGRKMRAWRAVTNLRSSWLSREILGFGLSFFSGIIFFIYPQSMLLAWLALSLSILVLIAVDQVYAYAKNKYTFLFHSSNLLMTGFLWISLAWLQAKPVIFLGALKIVLTLVAALVIYRRKKITTMKIIYYALRILFTMVALSYLVSGPAYLPYVVLLFLAGEITDRGLFYDDQELKGLGNHFNAWKQDQFRIYQSRNKQQ